jgi:hypothetical protein
VVYVGDLGIVAQVYALLDTDRIYIEECTLFIFGCPLSNCGISPFSWCTIRAQKDTHVESSQLSVVNGRSMLEASSSSNYSTTSMHGALSSTRRQDDMYLHMEALEGSHSNKKKIQSRSTT